MGLAGSVRLHRVQCCVLACVGAAALVVGGAAAQTPSLQTGPFTEQQAVAGLAAYQAHCANCHRPDLSGLNEARPLVGPDFIGQWRQRPAQQLVTYTQLTMPLPPGVPGSLGEQTYVNLVAFLLHANGAAPGEETLTASSTFVIGDAANGVMPDAVRQSLAQAAPPGYLGAVTGVTGLTVEGSVEDYSPVTDEMLRNPSPDDWLMIRGNYQAWSHSTLDQVNLENVSDLRLQWAWAMTGGGRSQPAPIVHNGILYLHNSGNVVQALDAAAGELIWEYRAGPSDGGAVRGIAIYEDKIFASTTNARLIALDARTGELVWDTAIGDRSEGDFRLSSGAIVINGNVVSGLGGCSRFPRGKVFHQRL